MLYAGPYGSTVSPGVPGMQVGEEARVAEDGESVLLVIELVVGRELLDVCLQGGGQRAQSRGGNPSSGSIPVEFLS